MGGRGIMPIQTVINDTKVPVKIWADQIEEAALKQLRNTASLPFIFKHVAVDGMIGKRLTYKTLKA